MKQTYRPWSIWKTFFLSGLLLFVIIRIFFTYNQYILDEVRANVEETLHETLVQQSHNFNTKIIADQESMDLIALQLKAYANIQDIPLDKLQEILAVTTFQTLAIIDLDGNLYATNGVETNIQDRDYFQGILEAKRIVTVVEDSRIQSKSEMLYTSPLYYEGKLYGSVMGTYDTTELQELFLTSFGGKGYSYIVSDDGDLIVNSLTDQALLQTKSILEWYENADFYSGDSFETMMYNLKHQISGIVRMSYLGEQRIIDYTALDVDGWNMMTAIDNNVIDQHARRIVLASLSVSFGLLAMLSFLVVVTLYSKKRREQAIEKIVSYDTLTSATTLSKFRVDASTLLEQQRNHSFVLIKLDIADFKMINRTYGYEKGNLVLKIIAESIESLHANYPQMVYCRFNTDEFLCLFPMMDQHWQIRTLTAYQQTARNVEASLNQPITLPMGCYAFESHENIPLSLAIERVNFAHRKAKIEGKHMVVFEDALEVL
ncbi:MAG: sensor domain-containing diguanylate cyclase, partial [Erysipelotrichaceae bacterium]